MKLSIITVNLNNKDGLQKTIDSVISQTFKGFEWIVIDGGSTDGSKELIKKYSDYISYWVSEPDKGIYNAMNKGIKVAKGEYLNFMNSGDYFYERDTLAKFINYDLKDDVIYGDWIRKYNEKAFFSMAPRVVSLDFFFSNNICHQAMFIKTSIFVSKGFDENFHIFADWAKWIDLCINGSSFRYIPVLICIFDATNSRSTRRDKRKNKEFQRLLEIHKNDLDLSINVKKKRNILDYWYSKFFNDAGILGKFRIICMTSHEVWGFKQKIYLFFSIFGLNKLVDTFRRN